MQSQMLYLLKLIRHMRTLLLILLIGFSAVASAAPISFGLFADTPYTQWQRENLANLISDMNKDSLSFVVHAGDIKNGSSTCNDTVYQDILETFQKSRHPFVYVPGDNEWTDCHHKLNTAYDPLERLEKLRSMFFSGKSSLGVTKIKLSRQSLQPDFLPYRENVRWEMGGILFATVNLPGSRNKFFRYDVWLRHTGRS